MEYALQSALYATLAGDATLAGLGVTVYDIAPQSTDGAPAAAFPYVEIGHMDSRDAGTKTSEGADIIVRIRTFTAAGSFTPARQIQARIWEILHRRQKAIAVAGHALTLIRRETSSVERDPDRVVHGECEYRALLEPLA